MGTQLQQVVDRLFAELHGQPLADWIADRREDGMSWRRIEKELFAKAGIDVSHITLMNWHRDDVEGAA